MKDFRSILSAAAVERDHPWCLATLVRAEGSSYRQPGARLLVYPDGRGTLGFLSGGCLEEEIARAGTRVLESGVPGLVYYDTRQLFGCNGRLSIYLEPVPAAGETGNFLTNLAERLGRRSGCRVSVPWAAAGASGLLPDLALVVERDGTFVQTLNPFPRLVVFGDGPETGPLRFFAEGLGWEFLQVAHPDAMPEDFIPDKSTAAVIMTHKFGRDLAALDRLFPLGLPYIGLLGPKKRHQELLQRYADFQGGILPLDRMDTLHAPAGLDTGSESPEEIAFSIVAEAAAVLSGRQGGFLRERTRAIHHRMEASA